MLSALFDDLILSRGVEALALFGADGRLVARRGQTAPRYFDFEEITRFLGPGVESLDRVQDWETAELQFARGRLILQRVGGVLPRGERGVFALFFELTVEPESSKRMARSLSERSRGQLARAEDAPERRGDDRPSPSAAVPDPTKLALDLGFEEP